MKKLALTLLALPLAVVANDAPQPTKPQNEIHFMVEVEQEVAMDILQVTLFVQEENANLNKLHQSLSNKLNAALSKIKAQNAVEIRSNNRHTQVGYDEKGRKNGWVEYAELVLESKDFDALSQLVDDLSDVLSIQSINAVLSSQAKEKLEDEITQQAFKKFQHKADLIKTSLNAKSYRLISIQQSTPHSREMMPYAAAELRMAKADSQPVQLEGGKSQLKTQLNAVIELIQE